MDQVYFFYEKCRKKELEEEKLSALTLANSLIYVSPSDSKSGARKKQSIWDKFIDSLTWGKIEERGKKKTTEDYKNIFGSLGVLVRNQKKKGDK